VEYWAAGQLLTHGADPYEAAATLRLERSAGWNTEQPEITLSPQVIFFLVAPLGLVGSKTGAVLWMILLVACLAISIRLLWILNGRRSGQLHLLCFCFAPVLTCLMAGQIGIFLMLGIVLFLYLHKPWPFLLTCVGGVLCKAASVLSLRGGSVFMGDEQEAVSHSDRHRRRPACRLCAYVLLRSPRLVTI
jgi:hypothetical protein